MSKNLFILLFCFFIDNVTSFNYISMNCNKPNTMKPIYVTKKWKITINNRPEKSYYDWLNFIWYNELYVNSIINSKIITYGDIYGKDSIRSINYFSNINQVITNTTYPSNILYKEYILPNRKSNKGEIKFINNKNNTELIWNINYTCLPYTENITYKLYDNIISNNLKKLKLFSERTKYQKINKRRV